MHGFSAAQTVMIRTIASLVLALKVGPASLAVGVLGSQHVILLVAWKTSAHKQKM
jgi:hypothetical protein